MGLTMDGLDADSYDRIYGDRPLLGRIASYYRRHAATMAFVAAVIMLGAVMNAAWPVLLARAIDTLAEGERARTTGALVAGILLADALA